MTLTPLQRQVASHAGVSAADVAAALRCTVEQVHAARRRLGRSIEDGLPGRGPAPAAPDRDFEDLARMARTNRSVCG